ncbi:uncharacterized protein N7484_003064 [Penicillium longicatenatum]|uniref:uncharacterized protein n=1 Tax=Penicillium longicatenatum TaxID=1561947 RepID=UPI00254961C3|nr:uncharacterized protein N7484_003064 [Penicillium longicatenatum]KAJ5649341.1 hypothetical protein N7484_003064 [Penicillium longicatenatum]
MRFTPIIALVLATLAIATPVEDSSNNVAAEADTARCRPRYDNCVEDCRRSHRGERCRSRCYDDWCRF